MAAPTVAADFIAVVRKSGLVEESKILELFPTPDDMPSDPQKVASLLLRAGHITGFQAKQLLAGKFRGFVLGAYKILEPIGKGGMGTVFLGEHTSLKRKVALKVLPADRANDKMAIDRFHREARAAAALDHPNIVRLHDISQGGGVHFLVMEYVDGNDLQSLMAKTGPLHYAQAAHYIAMAAAGLQHAHEKGFVHRDVKPANLILTKDGTVKLLDMGLTRNFTSAEDDLTGTLGDNAEVAGTADFVSPEQAFQKPVDERGDVYSLGATLFALVTGHPPFRGSTVEKLMQHQLADAPRLSRLKGVVPPALSDVVAKMLAKRPSDRYQSAADVIDALGPWLPAPTTGNVAQDPITNSDMMVAGAHTASRLRNTTAMTAALPKPEPKKSNRLLIIGVAAAGTVLLGGGIAALLTSGSSKPRLAASLPTQPPNPQQQAIKVTGSQPPVANPPTPTPAPNAAVTAKPAPAGQPGKVIYAARFNSLRPGRTLITKGFKQGPDANLPGWAYEVWDMTSAGEFNVESEDGQQHVNITSLSLPNSSQIRFAPAEVQLQLIPNRAYEIEYEYRTSPGMDGFGLIQTQGDWQAIGNIQLASSNQWRLGKCWFIMPPANKTIQIVFGPNRPVPGQHVSLRKIRIVEAGDSVAALPPVPAGTTVFASEFTGVSPGRKKVQAQETVNTSVLPGFPPHWFVQVWKDTTIAEVIVEATEAGPAIGISTVEGSPTAMLFTPQFDLPPGPLQLHLTYKSGPSGGKVRFLTHKPVHKPAFDLISLQPTDGEWSEEVYDVTVNDVTRGQLELHNYGVAGQTPLLIRSLKITRPGTAKPEAAKPAAPSPTTRAATVLTTTNFADQKPRKVIFQDGKYNKPDEALNAPHFTCFCWKPESVAEFRVEQTDAGPAFGMTNLNDVSSSQFVYQFEDLSKLEAGKKYKVRLEYKALNEAEGSVTVRKPDYNGVGGGVLAATDGKWKWAEFEFPRADERLHLAIENTSTGEGNLLSVRKVEIVAAE